MRKNRKTIQDVMYADLQKTIGINWKRLRLQHGLTRFDLVKQGIPYATVSNIESGATGKLLTTNLELVEKLAEIYSLEPDNVFKELTSPVSDETKEQICQLSGKEYTGVDLFDLYPYNLLPAMEQTDIFHRKIPMYSINPVLFEKAVDEFLTQREKLVLELRYRHQHTLDDVAKEFGNSRERIRQIESKALRKCRRYLDKYLLVPKYQLDSEIKKKQSLKTENRKLRIENYRLRELLPDNKEAVIKEQERCDDIFCIPLEELGFSTRTFNVLHRSGKRILEDLVNTTLKEYRNIRNLGRKSLDEVAGKLAEYGLEIPD